MPVIADTKFRKYRSVRCNCDATSCASRTETETEVSVTFKALDSDDVYSGYRLTVNMTWREAEALRNDLTRHIEWCQNVEKGQTP